MRSLAPIIIASGMSRLFSQFSSPYEVVANLAPASPPKRTLEKAALASSTASESPSSALRSLPPVCLFS